MVGKWIVYELVGGGLSAIIVAKCIALAVTDLQEDDPGRLLSGEAFAAAGVHGAVESDFFGWLVADPAGEDLISRIMAYARRFRLREVDSDVLKILYEIADRPGGTARAGRILHTRLAGGESCAPSGPAPDRANGARPCMRLLPLIEDPSFLGCLTAPRRYRCRTSGRSVRMVDG